MKKIIVIGGGIAGLSAAINIQQAGFETEVYEKNASAGGECTGWDRQGYHIDNCIHWLTGCRDGDKLGELWKNIGALDESTELYREPFFYKIDNNGVKLHFWSDVEKARKEFLDIAPEDSEELNKFFDAVKSAECLKVPCEKSMAEMNFIEYMKYGMTMAPMGRVIKEYGEENLQEFAQRFMNKYIKDMMTRYFNSMFKVVAMITSYAFYTGKSAAIPSGGSVGMVKRIVSRYESLGGKIHTGVSAVKINIEKDTAKSVSFSDGSVVDCDGVVCATDFSVTFGKLLDEKYMSKELKKMHTTPEGYRVSSGFNVSFGIIGEEDIGASSGSELFPCEEYKVATQRHDFIGIRLYDYDNELFPKDKRVIQCNLLQNEDDYDYWKAIYDDKEKYNAEKLRIAEELKSRIIAHHPELKDRLVLLCTYSPMTFTKWCNAYKGAYMSFYEQKGYKSLNAKCSINGLANVFVASQWSATNGGLPVAAAQGKFAANKLISMIEK